MQTKKQKYFQILKEIGMYHTLLKNQSKDLRFTLLIIAFTVTICATLAYKKPLITGEEMFVIITICTGVCAVLFFFLPKYLLWIKRKKIIEELKKRSSHSSSSIKTLEYLAES